MAKIKWHKIAEKDLIRQHGYEAVDRQYFRQTSQPKSRFEETISLGIHENHNWQPVLDAKGPHAGKIICNTCNGKFVTWLSKEHTRLIRQK
jgi:hypothetical protein